MALLLLLRLTPYSSRKRTLMLLCRVFRATLLTARRTVNLAALFLSLLSLSLLLTLLLERREQSLLHSLIPLLLGSVRPLRSPRLLLRLLPLLRRSALLLHLPTPQLILFTIFLLTVLSFLRRGGSLLL